MMIIEGENSYEKRNNFDFGIMYGVVDRLF